MADLEYTVTNQGIATTKTSRLVSGTIGVYTVKFTFNNVWDGLEKWATFDPIPGTPYKQPLDANGECTIPGEVMGGVYLRIGVFGLAEGQAYPTIWASKLPLEEGCFVNVPPSDWPEPSPLLEDVVKVSEQTFTDAQKTQARTNIGAAGSAEMTTALAGKVDKPVGATEGNVAVIGSNGNIVDGGHRSTDAFPVESASGGIVTIEDGADKVPVKTMTVQIEPNQKASTNDPSPSNILPIKGWTSAPVHRTRKNLWNGSSDELLEYIPSGTYDATNRTFTYAASALSYYPNKKGMIGLVYFPFKENTRYTLIFTIYKSSGKGTNMKCVYTDGTETVLPQVTAAGAKKTIIFTSAANKTIYYISKYNSSGNTTIYLDESGVFEGVLTAEDFEPYVGNTYEIEFPDEAGTVYGGELTVNEDGTGTLVSDWRYARLQGTVTQYPGTGYELMYYMTGWQDGKTHINGNGASYEASYRMCNMLKSVPNVATAKTDRGTFSFAEGSSTAANCFYGVYPDGVTSASEMSTWLTNNEVYIAYKLQTAQTYQLTAEQVTTLLGLNNIWADTGDISVEYHADPTIFVEEKTKAIKQSIAPIEDGYTASQAYAVGSFLFVGDTLYKVTSAIASGATITPGTNAIATTVAEQLMALA